MKCKHCGADITYWRDHWSHALETMGEFGNYNERGCANAEPEDKQ